jgi:hypothetical protein
MWDIWRNWACPRSANWMVCPDRPRLCDEGRKFLSLLALFEFVRGYLHEFIVLTSFNIPLSFIHPQRVIISVQSAKYEGDKTLQVSIHIPFGSPLGTLGHLMLSYFVFFAYLRRNLFEISQQWTLIQPAFAASQPKSI